MTYNIDLGPVYTTDHEVGPWKMAFVNGLSSWSEFIKIVLRALGPSLGVNRMWTKKSDHAPKNEGDDVFNTCPKRAILEKIKFAHSLVFSWASLVFTSC